MPVRVFGRHNRFRAIRFPQSNHSGPAKNGVSKKRLFKTSIKTPGLEVLWVLKKIPTLIRGISRLKLREIEGGNG
jgi:hypothetical protein